MTKQNVVKNDKSTHKYRDTIFRKLCEDEVKAIEIINAITGSNYCAKAKVELHDLESSLARRYNDVAISIEDELLVMIEHQSTINPNMPFRLLSYCVDIWRTWFVKTADLHLSRLHKIPTPKFYVLYNGSDSLEKEIYSLSEMFRIVPSENSLELVVHVVDINYQNGHDVLVKSDALGGYAYLMEKIRAYQDTGMSRDKSIATALQHCIQNDILREFLENNYEQVINMIGWDYDPEVEREVIRREAIEEGLQLGIEKGIEQERIKSDLKKLEIAKNFLDMNLPIEDVATGTGLSLEEVEQLLHEAKS